MKEVSEEVMLGASIRRGISTAPYRSSFRRSWAGRKRTYCHEVNDEELRQTIIKELYDKAFHRHERQ